MTLVTVQDIEKARPIIMPHLHRTPMLSATLLGQMLGINLYFKAELFQKSGSFKPRGALNKLNSLTPEEKARGVIGVSAGNHAAGLAYASSTMGIKATIVMPESAIRAKVEATRAYGATAVLHGGMKDVFPKMHELQAEHNYTLVHPFDDPLVIAGQGTVGLEILEDIPAPDVVILGIGGGGLISGVATAIKSKHPSTRIIGVEPTGATSMLDSLQQGKPVSASQVKTVADGLAAPFAGEHTYEHVKAYVDEVVLVTDEEIIAAMLLIMERSKLFVETAASAGFAALLHHKVNIAPGSTVVCVLSGGNIDRERLKSLL
ncbi:MAG: threonine/serine dehydratase [Anaerolineae bacterium]